MQKELTLADKSCTAKVKETIRLFNKHYLHFVQEEEQRFAKAKAEADKAAKKASKSKVLLGDSFFREREYRRAIHSYKQALQYYKMIPKQNMGSSRSSLSSNMSYSPNSCNVSVINENEVKFKIASCHCSLNENKAALVEMEGIPSKARNLPMNLLLGKLYRISRHSRAAVAIYKECLRHCPYVLEAITALSELGSTAKDIISLFPQEIAQQVWLCLQLQMLLLCPQFCTSHGISLADMSTRP